MGRRLQISRTVRPRGQGERRFRLPSPGDLVDDRGRPVGVRPVSKSGSERSVGSNPTTRTIFENGLSRSMWRRVIAMVRTVPS